MIDDKLLKEMIEFCKIVGKLKKVERTGWVTQFGMKDPESVAEHTFRTAVITMLVADLKNSKIGESNQKLDLEKMIRMALLHDLHEVFMGDWDNIAKKKLGKEKKKEREKESIDLLMNKLPEGLRKKYKDLWEELQEGKTEEAKLLKQIDRLECDFQVLEYEKEGYDKETLTKFLDYDRDKIKDPDLKRIFEMLEKERS